MKYSGLGMSATFGAVGLGCITSADIAMSANIYTGNCAGSTYVVRVPGTVDTTFTVNSMLDTDNNDVATTLLAGTTGTFTLSTNLTLGPQYTCSAIIQDNNSSIPTDGMSSGSLTIVADGEVTIT